METINKNHNNNKGQVTFVNLLAIIITIIVYLAMLPVINSMVENTVVILEATPNDYTPLTVALLHMISFVVLLAIMITALNYANPPRY